MLKTGFDILLLYFDKCRYLRYIQNKSTGIDIFIEAIVYEVFYYFIVSKGNILLKNINLKIAFVKDISCFGFAEPKTNDVSV